MLLGVVRQWWCCVLNTSHSDPRDPSSLFHFAKFLDKCGRLDEAEEYYLHALELDANIPACLKEYVFDVVLF